MAREARDSIVEDDVLRAGWLVLPDEQIVMFLDCSKSDDSTGLIGVRVSDGYTFTLGIWQKPRGERGESWLAPREEVDKRVDEVFARFSDILAFWGDPSHAKDDEDDSRYWDGLFDRWHRKYKDRLQFWAVKTGDHLHAVMWDMTSPARTSAFVAAAETFVSDMEQLDDIEEFAPRFRHDGHPALINHLKNAIRNPGRWGVSLMKKHRESADKIDLAVCAVGAHMLRRVVLLRESEEETPKNGQVWGAWT